VSKDTEFLVSLLTLPVICTDGSIWTLEREDALGAIPVLSTMGSVLSGKFCARTLMVGALITPKKEKQAS
jgi:hypothetical protein